MNNRRKALTLTAALMAATLMPVQADDRVPSANRVEFLAGYLTLTDAQKTQAATLFTAASTALENLRGQETAARTALTTAIKANAVDAELDRLSAALGTLHGQMTAVSAKANARFYALLTAEQKTKYDALGNRVADGSGTGGGRRP